MPKLIQTIIHQHPVTFNAGPRIEKTEIYEYEGKQTIVNFWYEGGRLIRLT